MFNLYFFIFVDIFSGRTPSNIFKYIRFLQMAFCGFKFCKNYTKTILKTIIKMGKNDQFSTNWQICFTSAVPYYQ